MKHLLIFCLSFSIVTCAHADISDDKTPLMHAATAGNTVEMRTLIQSGANVNAVAFREQPHGGFPVLRYAIDSRSLEAVVLLLEAGANVHDFTDSPLITADNLPNMRNLSLLSHAIHTRAPIEIINALIAYGADINGNPKIAGDWSALMVAAYNGYIEAVQVLLDAGADISLINTMDNKSAIDYAREQKHSDIEDLLLKYHAAKA